MAANIPKLNLNLLQVSENVFNSFLIVEIALQSALHLFKHKMLFSTLAIASLSSITLASPLTSGSPASSALGRLAKRTPWNLDSKLDTKIQAALTTGLKDAISIAATVLDANNGLKNKAKNDQYLIDYFGTNDDQTYDQVRRVFENLVGTNPDGTGSNIPANVYVDSNDWLIPDVGKGPGGGGDGKKHLCDFANEGGQSLTAYTALHPSSKSKWGMHFCPKWETRVENGYSLDRLVANNCEALKDTTVMDTTLMGRQNYAFAILHEFFHVREVARDVTAKYVRDWAYGAWDVLQLALGRVKKPGRVGVAEPFENADTFTWYAMVSTPLPSSVLQDPY